MRIFLLVGAPAAAAAAAKLDAFEALEVPIDRAPALATLVPSGNALALAGAALATPVLLITLWKFEGGESGATAPAASICTSPSARPLKRWKSLAATMKPPMATIIGAIMYAASLPLSAASF